MSRHTQSLSVYHQFPRMPTPVIYLDMRSWVRVEQSQLRANSVCLCTAIEKMRVSLLRDARNKIGTQLVVQVGCHVIRGFLTLTYLYVPVAGNWRFRFRSAGRCTPCVTFNVLHSPYWQSEKDDVYHGGSLLSGGIIHETLPWSIFLLDLIRKRDCDDQR